ncbi:MULTISPECIES: GntR family transcriptional regulator [unclassified Pseudofrankia]|uniref:GntR family transcriptional regulator n=1 Tax=unclassified Pseudofrankia TaxID=2994372 RepID=UPI0008D9A2C3|nr:MULTISPECIES: GntR family transcriptional regulator [unclassified Pseudofrankia]MDT3445807.1 GntR family transcriptional regulator [Pseudofrankia sp. BMG5.37]OHV57574.1 GntR family transcriptional regulator [Pseudofrankia sp. BMG5.36]
MPRQTQTDRVYDVLRADILAGRLPPGAKLPFADLCTRYSTSVGVVRESLSRLSAQGLVVSEPQIGFRVTPLTHTDLLALTEARIFVEGHVIRLSIQNGDVEWEAALVAAHHTLERTSQTVPEDPHRLSEEWAAAHARFHAVALQACPNRRLLDIAESLRASAELYRRWSVPLGASTRDVPAEHRRILAAALAGEAEEAAAALCDHIARTTQLLDDAATADSPESDEVSRAPSR